MNVGQRKNLSRIPQGMVAQDRGLGLQGGPDRGLGLQGGPDRGLTVPMRRGRGVLGTSSGRREEMMPKIGQGERCFRGVGLMNQAGMA